MAPKTNQCFSNLEIIDMEILFCIPVCLKQTIGITVFFFIIKNNSLYKKIQNMCRAWTNEGEEKYGAGTFLK